MVAVAVIAVAAGFEIHGVDDEAHVGKLAGFRKLLDGGDVPLVYPVAADDVQGNIRVAGEDGRVCGMKCIKMELGEPDASGRRRPIPVEGSEFVLDVDMVIMALGTSPNPLIRSTTPGLETNKKGGIIVDENEMSTRENVFAGGDAVTGAATVILAMGAGKKAAEAIDRKLQGK